MAKAGAGASEFFDSKAKSKWERKVNKAQQLFVTGLLVYLVIRYLKLISLSRCNLNTYSLEDISSNIFHGGTYAASFVC